MPLLVLVGHPCSGKSRRAAELAAHYTSSGLDVTVLSPESLGMTRHTMYSNSESERKTRAALKSALERFLSPSPHRLLIFDYLNSIKGYRYEAWCRAREMQTTTATLFVDTSTEICMAWHEARAAEERYEEKVFVDLCQRMEAPNGEKRWDAPLFTVAPDGALDFAALDAVLLHGKVAPANIAVIPARMEAGGYLTELDRVTSAIVWAIVDAQAGGADGGGAMVGDQITVPQTKARVLLSRPVHLPELRRIQAAYLKMARLRTPDDGGAIAASFVEHVNMCVRTPGSTVGAGSSSGMRTATKQAAAAAASAAQAAAAAAPSAAATAAAAAAAPAPGAQ